MDKVAFYKKYHETKEDSCVTRVWSTLKMEWFCGFYGIFVSKRHIHNDLMCCGRSELLPHSSFYLWFAFELKWNSETKWNILATTLAITGLKAANCQEGSKSNVFLLIYKRFFLFSVPLSIVYSLFGSGFLTSKCHLFVWWSSFAVCAMSFLTYFLVFIKLTVCRRVAFVYSNSHSCISLQMILIVGCSIYVYFTKSILGTLSARVDFKHFFPFNHTVQANKYICSMDQITNCVCFYKQISIFWWNELHLSRSSTLPKKKQFFNEVSTIWFSLIPWA